MNVKNGGLRAVSEVCSPIETVSAEGTLLFRDDLVGIRVAHRETEPVDVVLDVLNPTAKSQSPPFVTLKRHLHQFPHDTVVPSHPNLVVEIEMCNTKVLPKDKPRLLQMVCIRLSQGCFVLFLAKEVNSM